MVESEEELKSLLMNLWGRKCSPRPTPPPSWLLLRIKIAGRNINNLRYADDTTLMAESEEELKSLLMKVKEESEKLA